MGGRVILAVYVAQKDRVSLFWGHIYLLAWF